MRGFIRVITYAVADMQCSKSFFSFPGEKTGRKSTCVSRNGINGSIINDFNSAVFYRKFHDKLVQVRSHTVTYKLRQKNFEAFYKLCITNRKLFCFRFYNNEKISIYFLMFIETLHRLK